MQENDLTCITQRLFFDLGREELSVPFWNWVSLQHNSPDYPVLTGKEALQFIITSKISLEHKHPVLIKGWPSEAVKRKRGGRVR